MKLRRVISDGRLELQSAGADGSWTPEPNPEALGGTVFSPDWDLANAQRHHDLSGNVLPFQPASFRDFMVFEKHAVDAARGLVGRFMPAAAPIGSGQGVLNPNNIKIILERANVPIIVDAGVGTASDVTAAMELGADGVLLNTGVACAQDPLRMARAMRHAIEAGRDAYLAGRIPRKLYATASSPIEGTIGS